MYEGTTYELLLGRMLGRAAEQGVDTREGSLAWLGAAPAAAELQNLYIALDNILLETFASTASRPYLILRAAEKGLSPYPATAAVLRLHCTPESLPLAIGTRFSAGELNYAVTEALGGGDYAITCETPGAAGNGCTAAAIPIEYAAGLESCKLAGVLIPGEDEEGTESFRRRYLGALQSRAFGGNRADYKARAGALPGVGGCKVYPVWNGSLAPSSLLPPGSAAGWLAGLEGAPGEVKSWLEAVYRAASEKLLTVGGTVRVVVIDSTFSVPSAALVGAVQTALDPTQNAGEGVGLAPIGHVVKVDGAAAQPVDIELHLSFAAGWDWAAAQGAVEDVIDAYFRELAEGWADAEQLTVRISQIESRILSACAAMVTDISGTRLGGLEENLVLGPDCIPVRGWVDG